MIREAGRQAGSIHKKNVLAELLILILIFNI